MILLHDYLFIATQVYVFLVREICQNERPRPSRYLSSLCDMTTLRPTG